MENDSIGDLRLLKARLRSQRVARSTLTFCRKSYLSEYILRGAEPLRCI